MNGMPQTAITRHVVRRLRNVDISSGDVRVSVSMVGAETDGSYVRNIR